MSLLNAPFRLADFLSARSGYKKKLAGLLKARLQDIDGLYGKIDHSQFMRELLSRAGIKKGFFDLSMACLLRAPTLYVICRIIRPEIVVETGVANGFSSAFILHALEENNLGRLYSIDLPNQPGEEIACDKQTGWLVPEGLKKRWTLIIGSSQEKLPSLLEQLGKIDIFYHDSDHSYENMTFEFKQAYKFLDHDKLIISDDITDNRAFSDFCSSSGSRRLELFKLGILRK